MAYRNSLNDLYSFSTDVQVFQDKKFILIKHGRWNQHLAKSAPPIREGVTILAAEIDTILSKKSWVSTPQWKEGGVCLEYKISSGISLSIPTCWMTINGKLQKHKGARTGVLIAQNLQKARGFGSPHQTKNRTKMLASGEENKSWIMREWGCKSYDPVTNGGNEDFFLILVLMYYYVLLFT